MVHAICEVAQARVEYRAHKPPVHSAYLVTRAPLRTGTLQE